MAKLADYSEAFDSVAFETVPRKLLGVCFPWRTSHELFATWPAGNNSSKLATRPLCILTSHMVFLRARSCGQYYLIYFK